MNVENIAYACLTRFVENGEGSREALHWVDTDLSEQIYSFEYFDRESSRVAAILKQLGIVPGDTVSIFIPRSPILISAFFGVQKAMGISCILFGTLGEEGLLDRLSNSNAKIVITRKSLLRKITAIKDKLPALQQILTIDHDDHQSDSVLSLRKLMTETDPIFDYPRWVDAETPAFLQYTSGSTGKPKGALHVHGALGDMRQSFRDIMQLEADDLYWCTADPAWITGIVYGILAPFGTGARQVQYSGTYNADNWLKTLETLKVNIWYTAPTALRMLMQEDENKFTQYDFSSLKRMYSVGEPLNPEIYHWGRKVFKVEIYDTWWQSETG